jgi:hypothetical protein
MTPADKAQRLAKLLAWRWLKVAMPDVADGFLDEAYAEMGLNRRPVGRPAKDSGDDL